MKRRLSKSDIKGLNERLTKFNIELSKKDAVELLEGELGTFYLINNTPWFFLLDGELIPHLKLLLEKTSLLKRVTVDMGAVKFVANGADIMRPGVTDADATIAKDEFIVVVEETHGKPLAVGKALLGGEEMLAATGGKVVATLHYIGDKVWNM
jgi:PUA-domain protein